MRAPRADTVERWCWDYVLASSLAAKIDPGPVPEEWHEDGERRCIASPGRPKELRVVARAEKRRGLGSTTGRARALHTFWHHELQAAELMCWAVLAFPDTPREFRVGLVRIAQDEIRHMKIYDAQIERLGHHLGDFSVRDWFWERVPTVAEPASFVAVMGLGVESANLEHTATYAARFREAGDEEGARAQEIVGREEIAHVRFGAKWFQRFAGTLDFDSWKRALPPPLTPLLMRGRPIDREARLRAGQPERFVAELEAWQPDLPGS
jgi:uncharacterized ferritin-like protein (DUF455 family)